MPKDSREILEKYRRERDTGECKQRSVRFSSCAVKEQRLFTRPIKWPPDAYLHHLSHCATLEEEKKDETV